MARYGATYGSITWKAGAALATATIAQPIAYMGAQMTGAPTQPAPAGAATTSAMAFDERLVDAKLAAVEARTETKFAQLLGELKLVGASVTTLTGSIAEVRSDLRDVRTEVVAAKAATAGVKWNILATGIGLGAVILGLFAYGAQMLDLATGLIQAGGG